VHLCADLHGREHHAAKPLHLKNTLRDIHKQLVTDGVRDEITVIAGGGIALAEHMAKAIICGADLVAVDVPLLISLGCRLCGSTHPAQPANGTSEHDVCPANIDESSSKYATHRMVNLMGAWHSQLIEVLGAMGIREVRRLRGEVGRAIFMEDIEKEAFGELTRK
jgi:glutamate synthase domain-containing protein 2